MGAGGAEGGGVDFLYFYILCMRWNSNEAKGTSNVSIIKHSNESYRYASNLETKSFNIKYHITPEKY